MTINKLAISLAACMGMMTAGSVFASRNAELEIYYFDEVGNMVGETYYPCFGPVQQTGVQEGRMVQGFSTQCSRAATTAFCLTHRQSLFDPSRADPWYWESMNDTVNRCLNELQIPML